MKRTSPKFVCIAITGLGLAAYSASAAAEQTTAALLNNYLPSMAFPLVPRLTGIGLLGDEEVVGGDGMLPIYGNRNGVWYVDAQGKTAFDSSWVGSLGTGVRLVSSDTNIFGAYVFVDRNISPEKNDFWFISPGLESLGDILDFRVNGYFPTNTKQQYGSTDWADNFGVTDFVTFQGHQQFDILMTQDEEVGSWGGDAEVGARFPGLSNLRAYVGGYHFSFQDASDINGVAGRVELPVNRYLGVTARESYDNVQHNTIMVGLRVTLGGVNTHPADPHQPIQQRLLDPIERNMATLGQGNGEPIQSVLTPVSNGSNPPNPPTVERENIWYFSPSATGVFDGTITACTIEAPCINTDFMQATIDGINDLVLGSTEINKLINSTSPSFYLAPGNYNSLNGSGPLTFTNDWIFGRTADFRGDQQAAFLIGGLSFFGTSNQMNYVIAQNSLLFPQNAAVTLNPGSVLTLNHTRLGVDPFLPRIQDLNSDSYHIGIQMQDATVHVNQSSEIYAYATDNNNVVGINSNDSLIPGSTITVDSSLIHVLNNLDIGVFASPNNVVAAGIRTNDLTYKGTTGSSISVVKGDIKASAVGNIESVDKVNGPQVYGILGGGTFVPPSLTPLTLANGGEDITISGSSISASDSITVGVKSTSTVMGVSALSELENRITIDTTDISSDVNVVQGSATGVNASSTSGNAKNDITITGGKIDVDSSLDAFGINANSRFGSGNNTITLSGNLQISVDASNSTGVSMSSGSGNNLITLTGSQLAIAATVISNTTFGGQAVGISQSSSLLGNAGSNRLISSGGVSIAANATGVGLIQDQAVGILQTNNGVVSGGNQISAVDTSIIANSTLTKGPASAIGVRMIDTSSSGSVPNLLEISGNSSISVIASAVGKDDVTATGIDQRQQNGSGKRDNFAKIDGNTTVTVAATTGLSGKAIANGVLQARVGDGNNTTSTNSPNTKITASSTGDPTSSITFGIKQTISGTGINNSSGFPDGQISVSSSGTATKKSP